MPVQDYEDIELFDGKSGFLGAIGKIGRARYQLQDLDQRFRAFAEGRPYIVGADSCLCQVAISVATCSGSRLIAVVPGQSRAPRNHSCSLWKLGVAGSSPARSAFEAANARPGECPGSRRVPIGGAGACTTVSSLHDRAVAAPAERR